MYYKSGWGRACHIEPTSLRCMVNLLRRANKGQSAFQSNHPDVSISQREHCETIASCCCERTDHCQLWIRKLLGRGPARYLPREKR